MDMLQSYVYMNGLNFCLFSRYLYDLNGVNV